MKLLLVRHLWGVDLSEGFEAYLGRWREVGYQAIEASPRMVPDGRELKRVLKSQGLGWIPQVFSNMFDGGGTVAAHLRSLQEQMEECLDSEPLFFNTHSGSDAWTPNEAEDFYGSVRELETKFAVVCCHETHRSRYFGNPWNTYRLIQRMPSLKLTADFSHWVCVAERLLADAEQLFATIIPHCHHVHARVGYEEGPQVPDPRAPEWQAHLNIHERWWDAIWLAQKESRCNRLHPYSRIRAATLSSYSSIHGPTGCRPGRHLRLDGATTDATLHIFVVRSLHCLTGFNT